MFMMKEYLYVKQGGGRSHSRRQVCGRGSKQVGSVQGCQRQLPNGRTASTNKVAQI